MKEHRNEVINAIKESNRSCGKCGSNETLVALAKDRRNNNEFWHAYWRRNPLDKSMWLCNMCWRKVYWATKKK